MKVNVEDGSWPTQTLLFHSRIFFESMLLILFLLKYLLFKGGEFMCEPLADLEIPHTR